VELDEGPRLIAGIDDPPTDLAIDRRLTLTVRHESDVHFPSFSLAS
jgi:hypothetical protein